MTPYKKIYSKPIPPSIVYKSFDITIFVFSKLKYSSSVILTSDTSSNVESDEGRKLISYPLMLNLFVCLCVRYVPVCEHNVRCCSRQIVVGYNMMDSPTHEIKENDA